MDYNADPANADKLVFAQDLVNYIFRDKSDVYVQDIPDEDQDGVYAAFTESVRDAVEMLEDILENEVECNFLQMRQNPDVILSFAAHAIEVRQATFDEGFDARNFLNYCVHVSMLAHRFYPDVLEAPSLAVNAIMACFQRDMFAGGWDTLQLVAKSIQRTALCLETPSPDINDIQEYFPISEEAQYDWINVYNSRFYCGEIRTDLDIQQDEQLVPPDESVSSLESMELSIVSSESEGDSTDSISPSANERGTVSTFESSDVVFQQQERDTDNDFEAPSNESKTEASCTTLVSAASTHERDEKSSSSPSSDKPESSSESVELSMVSSESESHSTDSAQEEDEKSCSSSPPSGKPESSSGSMELSIVSSESESHSTDSAQEEDEKSCSSSLPSGKPESSSGSMELSIVSSESESHSTDSAQEEDEKSC